MRLMKKLDSCFSSSFMFCVYVNIFHCTINKWSKFLKVPCCFITARIWRMGEGTVFSLFVSSHLGGGYPIPGLGRGGGYPWPGQDGVTPPRPVTGYPQTWDGVPSRPGMGYPQTWDRVTPPDMGWGNPPDMGQGTLPRHGMGYPPDLGWSTPPDMGQGTPPDMGRGTPWNWDRVPPPTWDIASTCYVCLLRSRRRTFLFSNIFMKWSLHIPTKPSKHRIDKRPQVITCYELGHMKWIYILQYYCQ